MNFREITLIKNSSKFKILAAENSLVIFQYQIKLPVLQSFPLHID